MNRTAEAVAGTPNVGWFHPSGRTYRFTILIFISLLTFGSYFAFDSIGALSKTIIDALKVDHSTIGSLYSAYSIAAILTVFIGGVLIDKLGTRKATLLFSGLVTLGAIMVAFAHGKTGLFAGRLVFGAGSESLVVAQSAIISRWFKGKEMALAFGIALTISRLGTIFSFNTEVLIATVSPSWHFVQWLKVDGWRMALWVAAALCAFSLLCNLVSNGMDKHGEGILNLPKADGGDKVVFADILKFGASFWFVSLLCVTFYSAIFPFTALSTDMFATKWHFLDTSPTAGSFLYQVFFNFTHMFTTAGGITSIVIAASMIFAPFAGNLIDRIGKRASLMILGSLVLIPAHLLMGITHWNPIFCMVALGVAFVLVPAAMWPCVPLVVEEKRVGTAFGLMTAIQNLGLMVFPFLSGWLRDKTGTYTATQVMFACLGLAGLIFAIALLRADKRAGGVLEAGASS
jgi:MFS family permease